MPEFILAHNLLISQH